ncbi:hypothetical protein [Deinococcus sp.]|uniref:hypothetical protein n=1 Tax=Deinococcus sp. TaxID=47478 RepID=UPI0025E2B769|nr:hypothetical protein [Deinococcus sp.]
MTKSKYSSISLSTLISEKFSSIIKINDLYPDLLENIKSAIGAISEHILDRDLAISMPKLEEAVIEGVEMDSPSSDFEGETIGSEFRKYLSLLNQFNNYVGQGAEEALIQILNSTRFKILWYPLIHWNNLSRLKFIRNTVQFPDIHLIDTLDNTILLSIESKTWFLFSGDDITARFHVSPTYIKNDTLIVIFPWVMSKLISGSPIMYEPYICNARELAELRDKTWGAGGLKAFRKGLPFDSNRVRFASVDHLFESKVNNHNIKSSGYQSKIIGGLVVWEIETHNFGKIWRIYDEKINKIYKEKAFSNKLLGRTIKDWRRELGM